MAFLRRLAMLVGFLLGWLMFSLALPWIFTFIGAAILGAAIYSMVKEGQRHAPGMQFSIFGGVTMLLSLLSWFVIGGGASDDDYDREVMAAIERAEAPEAAEPAAPEAEPEPEGEADDEAEPEAAPEAAAAEAPAAADGIAEAAIAAANALPKDKVACADIAAVAALWGPLSEIKKGTPAFKPALKAVKKLEGCRKKAVKKIAKKERKAKLAELGMAKPLKLK